MVEVDRLSLEETLFAGISAIVGAVLSFYTYQHSASLIWPVLYSVFAVVGANKFLENINKIFWRSARNESDNECSPFNVATGTIIYFSSLYAFSEAWKWNNASWTFCLGIAACDLYFTLMSIYRSKNASFNVLLRCCQLAYQPVLIACGATYLLYFRNHDEEWLKLLALLTLFCNSLAFITLGSTIEGSDKEPKLWLLKAIKLLMGGCLLGISSTVLTVYFAVKKYLWIFTAYMAISSFSSMFVIFGSIFCFWDIAPRRVIRYSQRILGLLLTICSSIVSAYIAHHMGWQYSLTMMPFQCAGLYVAYKGFWRGDKPWQ